MRSRKQITIVLMFVIILAIAIEVSRSEFVIRLNRNENIKLIDVKRQSGVQIEKSLFEAVPDHRYLIIYEQQEKFTPIKENAEKLLNYIKYDYDAVEVSKVSNITNKYSAVILIVEDIDKLSIVDDLMNYIFNGGNVFFAYRLYATPDFFSIYRKLGIYEFGDFVQNSGISILNNVLIKGEGFQVTEQDLLENSSMSLRLTADCEIYAEALDGSTLLWKRKYGQGNIVYFNGTMLDTKINRGFMMGALSLLEDDFIYPIINSKITFIDDFPAPIPAGTHEKMTKEFGKTIPRFYKDIWWPDMLELASKYNIKYTGVVIGTYNDETEEVTPGSTDLSIKEYIFFGRELIAHGGEIGIHGYNHQPFSTAELIDKGLGYKPWKDIETMKAAVCEIMDLSKKAFPNYTFNVYVPPSNIIAPIGREAILASSPDIKIISSLYTKAEGEDAYAQEFSISSDGIIEFPRLTSGYISKDLNLWMMFNGITAHGFFSHFVHPDDILDPDRTGSIGWSELYREYTKYNKLVFDFFGWLRGLTASEGANEMIKYLQIEPKYEKTDAYIKGYCNNYYEKIYFILRSSKTIASVENCNIQEVDKNIYLVTINSPIWQINFKR